MSAGTTLYLLLEQNTEVSTRDVRLSDVAKMACTDEHALNRLKTIKLFRIPSGKKFRKTMTVVDIIEKMCIRDSQCAEHFQKLYVHFWKELYPVQQAVCERQGTGNAAL